MSTRAALAPLAIGPFRRFYLGRLTSLLGSSLVSVALAFAILELDNSAGAVGLVLAARTLPMVIGVLFGGVLADRFSRSLVLTVSHLCSGGTQALAAVLLLTGHAQLWHLVVIEAANGAVSAFTQPALGAVTPQLVPAEHLHAAAVLMAVSRNVTRIGGPVIAAFIVAAGHPGWALAVDAAAYLAAAAILAGLRLPPPERAEASSSWTDLRLGWREFIGRQWVWVITAGFFVVNLAYAMVTLTIGPVLAEETFGVTTWGVALSAQSIGLLVSSLVLGGRRFRHPFRGGLVAVCALALPMVALGTTGSGWLLVATFFLAGAGLQVFDVAWTVSTQEKIPGEVLGRVLSYDMLGAFGAVPLGALLAGPLSHWWGTGPVAVGAGATVVLAAAAMFVTPSVRDLVSGPPR